MTFQGVKKLVLAENQYHVAETPEATPEVEVRNVPYHRREGDRDEERLNVLRRNEDHPFDHDPELVPNPAEYLGNKSKAICLSDYLLLNNTTLKFYHLGR